MEVVLVVIQENPVEFVLEKHSPTHSYPYGWCYTIHLILHPCIFTQALSSNETCH